MSKLDITIESKPNTGKSIQDKVKEFNMSKLVLVTEGDKPNVELGIDQVLTVVDAFAELREAYDIAMEDDGKISFGDVIKHPVEIVYEPVKAAFKIWQGKELIIPQVLDIDMTEAEEIVLTVMQKFNVAEGQARSIIEHSIKALFHVKEVVFAFTKK